MLTFWQNLQLACGNTHDADESILRLHETLPAKVHLCTRGRTRIRFQSSGGNTGSNATFTFCDARGPAKVSAYAMANNGNLHSTAPDPVNVADACSGL